MFIALPCSIFLLFNLDNWVSYVIIGLTNLTFSIALTCVAKDKKRDYVYFSEIFKLGGWVIVWMLSCIVIVEVLGLTLNIPILLFGVFYLLIAFVEIVVHILSSLCFSTEKEVSE
ncbi:MAG: hypothetical protein U9P90_00655 [Patescibacteria group bacterium]|nr:hypothetical protein [Patescibacteria group bacterium]